MDNDATKEKIISNNVDKINSDRIKKNEDSENFEERNSLLYDNLELNNNTQIQKNFIQRKSRKVRDEDINVIYIKNFNQP